MISNKQLADQILSRLAASRGEVEADLLLKNGFVVNVFTGEVIKTNVAIKGGHIAALGDNYQEGHTVLDLEGKYLAPGLIDAHLHIESTLLLPTELSRIITTHGTTCVINEPHEIANVSGLAGVRLMLDASQGLPCDYYSTAPSCVPATAMETAGSELNAAEVTELLGDSKVVGLGEMMNYPGVIAGDEEVLAKLAAAQLAGKVIDGHAPAVEGAALQTYLSAGISTDHECITAEEALAKLRGGMKIIIRHGSASSSLAELLPLVNALNAGSFMFGSDDRDAGELLGKGHLDDLLKTAVALGADPLLMIRLATINAARHYRLYDRGALAPGYRADLVVFDDLKSFHAHLVVKDGRLVAREGELLVKIPEYQPPQKALNSVKLRRPVNENDFVLTLPAGKNPVIGVVPGQLITEKLLLDPKRGLDGAVVADAAAAINILAVVERHRGSGRMAVALVRGIGLERGAIASSVAHDSHNIIVAGVEEKAMAAAVNELAGIGGGFVAVDEKGELIASLPLPVAGLISTKSAVEVAAEMEKLLAAVAQLGSKLPQPFMTLSFLALPVIPTLKITDRGLFDVEAFKFL
ncbi:MAG: adenine deaminase [Dethiobacteria bacterium]|nr:adenine deaminase [Dethiobacteria bacterium]